MRMSGHARCCKSLQVPQGTWRTRHLRLKAQWFLERVENQQYMCYHLPGAFMTADMLTKPLQSSKLCEFMRSLGFSQVSEAKGQASCGESAVKHVLATNSSEPTAPESKEKCERETVDPCLGSKGVDVAEPGGDLCRRNMLRAVKVLLLAASLKQARKVTVEVDVEDGPGKSGDQLACLVGL